jgi:hypothetical protein
MDRVSEASVDRLQESLPSRIANPLAFFYSTSIKERTPVSRRVYFGQLVQRSSDMSKVTWRIAPLREDLQSNNHRLRERARMAPNQPP